MAGRMGNAVHGYLRSTRPYHYLTTQPPRAQPETEVKKPADRPIPHTSITAPKVHQDSTTQERASVAPGGDSVNETGRSH